ncbi:MAG: exodeoxyribonuclease VII small subunit [Deltaproteobacteria bacterium RBG_16_71_12]|nr:MAG: exodeoxyribonuclease VII small subunit [Deltaproteobacteria bacterium RBG_16_71_12]
MSGKKTSSSSAAADGEASFESVLERLEAVVQRLERGDLSLDDSLKAYEEGIGLVRSAQGRLDGMERRLEELLADGRTAPLVPPSDDEG